MNILKNNKEELVRILIKRYPPNKFVEHPEISCVFQINNIEWFNEFIEMLIINKTIDEKIGNKLLIK